MASVLRNARLIGALTLLSRVLGMLRDILMAHVLGVGAVVSAFVLANRVPNLFRRLFGEGALTAAFVPPFVERLEQGKREEAFLLLRRLVTALTLLLGVLAAAGAGLTVLVARDSLEGEYLRIMLPYLVLICVGAILAAALNGLRHFFMPAFAPVLANVVLIGVLLAFSSAAPDTLGRFLAWGVLAGGVVQLVAMALPLRAKGVSLRPDLALSDPALRTVVVRFAPLVLGLSLVQINEFINTLIASAMVPGKDAVGSLYYANQIVQLPLSLVGTAMATAILPPMSAAAAAGRDSDMSDLLARGLRDTLRLSVPAAVGLVVLAEPIIQAIFERGAFTSADTVRVARVMALYALSLPFYCANQIQVRALYAKGDTRTPVVVSASMVVLTLALSLILVGPMRESGIALATSVGGLGSFVALQLLLRRRVPVAYGPLVRDAAVVVAGSALMAAVAWGVREVLPPAWGRYVRLAVPIAAAMLVYGLIMRYGTRRDDRRVSGPDPKDVPRA